MNRKLSVSARVLGFAALVSVTGFATWQMAPQFPDLAFDAGTRQAPAPAPAHNPRLAPMSDLPVEPSLPFGFNKGDCPTEDSCRPVFEGGVWRIERIVP